MKIQYEKQIVNIYKSNNEIEIENEKNCYFKYRGGKHGSKFAYSNEGYLGLFQKDKLINGHISENICIHITDNNISYDRCTSPSYFFKNHIKDLYENCKTVEIISEEQFFQILEREKQLFSK